MNISSTLIDSKGRILDSYVYPNGVVYVSKGKKLSDLEFEHLRRKRIAGEIKPLLTNKEEHQRSQKFHSRKKDLTLFHSRLNLLKNSVIIFDRELVQNEPKEKLEDRLNTLTYSIQDLLEEDLCHYLGDLYLSGNNFHQSALRLYVGGLAQELYSRTPDSEVNVENLIKSALLFNVGELFSDNEEESKKNTLEILEEKGLLNQTIYEGINSLMASSLEDSNINEYLQLPFIYASSIINSRTNNSFENPNKNLIHTISENKDVFTPHIVRAFVSIQGPYPIGAMIQEDRTTNYIIHSPIDDEEETIPKAYNLTRITNNAKIQLPKPNTLEIKTVKELNQGRNAHKEKKYRVVDHADFSWPKFGPERIWEDK